MAKYRYGKAVRRREYNNSSERANRRQARQEKLKLWRNGIFHFNLPTNDSAINQFSRSKHNLDSLQGKQKVEDFKKEHPSDERKSQNILENHTVPFYYHHLFYNNNSKLLRNLSFSNVQILHSALSEKCFSVVEKIGKIGELLDDTLLLHKIYKEERNISRSISSRTIDEHDKIVKNNALEDKKATYLRQIITKSIRDLRMSTVVICYEKSRIMKRFENVSYIFDGTNEDETNKNRHRTSINVFSDDNIESEYQILYLTIKQAMEYHERKCRCLLRKLRNQLFTLNDRHDHDYTNSFTLDETLNTCIEESPNLDRQREEIPKCYDVDDKRNVIESAKKHLDDEDIAAGKNKKRGYVRRLQNALKLGNSCVL